MVQKLQTPPDLPQLIMGYSCTDDSFFFFYIKLKSVIYICDQGQQQVDFTGVKQPAWSYQRLTK